MITIMTYGLLSFGPSTQFFELFPILAAVVCYFVVFYGFVNENWYA